MLRKLLSTVICLSLCVSALAQEPVVKPPKVKHTTPPLIHLVKGVVCSPYDAEHVKFPRGLKPSDPKKLAAAPKFDASKVKSVPSQVLMIPTQVSMWGNDQYGDCVTASECARIAAYSVYCGLPETFIPEATCISWARKGGYLDGANLTDVMTDRQTRGLADASGKLYLAGPYSSVDFSSEAALQAALSIGPVNFGIDANALPSAAGNNQGWYAFGGTPGSFNNEDHCTPSFGYVTGATSAAVAFKALGVPVPANAPTGNVYLWFTWNTIGVVDHAWIMSTAGEAWVQNPTTVGQSPTPAPPTPVPPTPGPTPAPGGPITIVLNTDGTWTMTGVPSVLTPDEIATLKAIVDKLGKTGNLGGKRIEVPLPLPKADPVPLQKSQIDELRKELADLRAKQEADLNEIAAAFAKRDGKPAPKHSSSGTHAPFEPVPAEYAELMRIINRPIGGYLPPPQPGPFSPADPRVAKWLK